MCMPMKTVERWHSEGTSPRVQNVHQYRVITSHPQATLTYNPPGRNGPTNQGRGTAQAPAGLQTTPASSLCAQSCRPQPPCRHSVTSLSVPLQFTLASQIGPRPLSNAPPSRAVPPEYPSDWHTTKASVSSQPSSQTVPHTLLCRTSTRPDSLSGPPTRRVLAAQKKQTQLHHYPGEAGHQQHDCPFA